jgi:hypothetical protein
MEKLQAFAPPARAARRAIGAIRVFPANRVLGVKQGAQGLMVRPEPMGRRVTKAIGARKAHRAR